MSHQDNKRVVFVSLKASSSSSETEANTNSNLNPRTRRKRALGVDPLTTSFAEFKTQVANRLQLKFGIKSIRHKGSGMLVKSVEDLLDIEDLEVEEFREEEVQTANGGYGSTAQTISTSGGLNNKRDESNNNASSSSRNSVLDQNNANTSSNEKDGDDDAEKYKRRTSMATRQMQKVLPYAYSKKLNPAGSGNNEGLDDSKNFSGSSSSGGKKSWFSDPRAIVVAVSLISCLLTMVLLYQRVSMLESEIDSARNAGVLKTDGMKKKESRTRMAIEKIEKAALEAEEAGEMYVPEA
ncbi:unnamed protein product [Bathycoccus prasinos]